MTQHIACPECGAHVSLSEMVTQELKQDWQQEAAKDFELQKKDYEVQLREHKAKLQTQQQQEIDMRKKLRHLEQQAADVELELQRRLDKEKANIHAQAVAKLNAGFDLKIADKDQQLEQMRRTIDELKQKSEQGSQQQQGEALELVLEHQLSSWFPMDDIQPVPKGVRGADVVHVVQSRHGQKAGTILWETKRTKHWSDGWLSKLKDDQRSIQADCAVIVTQTLPKEAGPLSCIEGVWVVDFNTVKGTALALRETLLQLQHAQAAAMDKDDKLDYLYRYLTGAAFKQRIEAIVENFTAMQQDLEKEKRAIQKCWATREQYMQRVLSSTVGMYGDIEGIVGSKSLPKIEALMLEE